jgi:hypothetical protein
MPNYIINQCLTNDDYIISADTLTVGITYEFGIGETIFCGTVEAVTEESITPGYYYDFSEYSNCCECLEGDGRESLNFKFIRCDTSEEINIEATDFCGQYGAPTTGLTYEIQFGSETSFCATFDGLSESGTTNYSYVSGPFSLCEDCGEQPPISAGTETIMCVLDCSGNTITVVPPHPTYLNEYGKAVVQLNMVELGGMNGLNS